ncbi:MAG: hypothetical protein UR12_C0001G0030 [candidate division TM6 bacterium GW2011_GWF2_30_66]|jgi:hypothetical protein|nr:MAG: hypothetical protein UR12_C0001G0030 [candidate division TM6 bacterium GW2011_GWF2_30_66]
MKLIEFIDKIKTPIFDSVGKFGEADKPSAISQIIYHFKFQEKQNPSIFLSFFIKKFREAISQQISSEIINLVSCENMILKSKLETTFLGQKKLYWLDGLMDLKPKEQVPFINYLENYSGPNYIVFCSDASINLGLNKNKVIVDIDNFVDQKMFAKLAEFLLGVKLNSSKSFNKIILDIFSKNSRLTLDQSCTIMNYAYLAGASYKEFADSWLDKIIAPDKSLFTLSQYFFDKNAQVFLKLWLEIKDEYPEQFWLTFWSEQVWRACNYIKLMQEKKMVEAKKISFRLPFSFMQKSWKNFTVIELVNAHSFLYSVDYSLKNGGDVFSIDLFYSRFLSGNFE